MYKSFLYDDVIYSHESVSETDIFLSFESLIYHDILHNPESFI